LEALFVGLRNHLGHAPHVPLAQRRLYQTAEVGRAAERNRKLS
jgi:hypothetical protein